MTTLEQLKKSPKLRKKFINVLKNQIFSETVKQTMYSNDCYIAVASTITGIPVCKIKKFIEDRTGNTGKDGYYDREIYEFLLSENYMMGLHVIEPDKESLKKDSILIEIPLFIPAIFTVELEVNGEKKLHALYWDGLNVRNPDPLVKQDKKLKDYKIMKWFPIEKLEEEEDHYR